ncbi:hypothetical protein Tsubulata_038252 [Turnera subulata]|uniref:CCHC-type domain-containing protein n=1 Tax=Turnera subulata TaxID=218843 RepID=A0A9Q0GAN3_9ROSI|nr:hypothetical protein Tsubulata_038252 [Turnera subulata]
MEASSSSQAQSKDGHTIRTLRLSRNPDQRKAFSEHVLVGKLVTSKAMSHHLLKMFVSCIWNLQGALEVKGLERNVFLLSFQFSEDRSKALHGGQWVVNGSLLLVREWGPKATLAEVDLSTADFWVLAHGLLLEQLTIENAACIAGMLEELVGVDLTLRNRVCRSNILKFKVRMNVDLPLCPGFQDDDGEGCSRWVDLSYKNLPDHCFACGRIGHMMKVCPYDGREGVSKEVIRFGHKLRAEPDFHKRRTREWKRITQPWRDALAGEKERRAMYDETEARLVEFTECVRKKKEERRVAEETSGRDPTTTRSNWLLGFGDWVPKIQNWKKFVRSWGLGCLTRWMLSTSSLAVFWKDDIDVTLLSWSGSHIDVVVKDLGQHCWRFTGFYGNPVEGERHHSWELLKRLSECNNLPWICAGDFNEVTRAEEKLGGPPKPERLMAAFKNCLDRCGLQDMGYTGYPFTWTNGRGGIRNTKLRLDRCVCTSGWRALFPNARVLYLYDPGSDHIPVLVDCWGTLLVRRRRQRKRFYFEDHWLRDDDCREVVKSVWENGGSRDSWSEVAMKFEKTREELSGWNHRKHGSIPEAIGKTRAELEFLQGAESSDEN